MPPDVQKAVTITAKRPGRYKQPNVWRFLLTQTQPNPPDNLSKVSTRLAVSYVSNIRESGPGYTLAALDRDIRS